MCRAVWVAVVGGSEEACHRLRRAAGPDAQVVVMATDPAPLLEEEKSADAVVIDGEAEGATALAQGLAARSPNTAIVWVGPSAPPEAHQGVAWDDIDATLPGAITKALLARGGAGRNT
jgi:hypothetical protein